MRTHSTLLTSCAAAALLLSACHATNKGGNSSTGSSAGTGDHVLGGATSLQIVAAPVTSLVAGDTFSMTVQVLDDGGHPYTGTPLQLHLAGQGSVGTPALSANANATTQGGVATFTNVSITLAGDFNIVCTVVGDGSVEAVSAPLTVKPGVATQLIFVAQPGDQLPNTDFSPPVAMGFADKYDNVDPTTNDNVTLSLGASPNQTAQLTGTLQKPTNQGSTLFTDLQLDILGSGYSLHAEGHGFHADSSTLSVRESSWRSITSAVAVNNMNDIAWSGVADDGTLIVSGPGVTATSADNGNHYTAQASPSDHQFRNLLVAPGSASVLYADAVLNGSLYPVQRSGNGGSSWTPYPGLNQHLVAASDAETVFAVGTADNTHGPLAISTDGAQSFKAIQPPSSQVILAVGKDSSAPGVLYAADANHLYQSADNGANWGTPLPLPASGGWRALEIHQSSGHLYLYGTEGLWRTADNGNSWTQLLFIGVNDLALTSDPNTLYAVANNVPNSAVAVVGTTDAGGSWSDAGWGLPAFDGGCTVHLSASPQDTRTVFFSISQTGSCELLKANSGIYRTVNGGF